MEKKTVYFVTYYSPGTFFFNEWDEVVESTDPDQIVWPDNAFSFTLHKREDVHDNDQIYRGTPEQLGGYFFHPDSKVETIEEVLKNPNSNNILKLNVEANNWTHIAWSRWNNYPTPFNPHKDKVLSKKT